MTSDQYTELVAFLERKFAEVQRHSTTLFEQNREELRIFAEGTNARFDKVDERFDQMDERFDRMDGRLDGMDGRLGSLEGSFVSLDEWVRRAVTGHESPLQALE